MIVDTSALVAILLREPDAALIRDALLGSPRNSMSVGSWVELAAVLVRKMGVAEPEPVLDTLLGDLKIELQPLSTPQGALAIAAYARFGRGTGHAAKLNFGDCFAYALAKANGEPLLFKGDDFAATDIRAVL